MNPLIVDIETTGLIPKVIDGETGKKRSADWRNEYMLFPWIVSISWAFEGKEHDYIIKPDGYDIPEEASDIHGITTEKAARDGWDLGVILPKFCDHAMKADLIVGHGLYFDSSIIKANTRAIMSDEMNVHMDIALDKGRRLDTMMKTIKFVGAKQENGSGKFPTLSELYHKIFSETFDDAHTSMADVRATKACYEALLNMGVI